MTIRVGWGSPTMKAQMEANSTETAFIWAFPPCACASRLQRSLPEDHDRHGFQQDPEVLHRRLAPDVLQIEA